MVSRRFDDNRNLMTLTSKKNAAKCKKTEKPIALDRLLRGGKGVENALEHFSKWRKPGIDWYPTHFRQKSGNGWGTEVYGKTQNALEEELCASLHLSMTSFAAAIAQRDRTRNAGASAVCQHRGTLVGVGCVVGQNPVEIGHRVDRIGLCAICQIEAANSNIQMARFSHSEGLLHRQIEVQRSWRFDVGRIDGPLLTKGWQRHAARVDKSCVDVSVAVPWVAGVRREDTVWRVSCRTRQVGIDPCVGAKPGVRWGPYRR